ncbi:hypothetical protein [Prochlorococcus marinus]|nr:hypothetical protein [Prochlorococcus marinus]
MEVIHERNAHKFPYDLTAPDFASIVLITTAIGKAINLFSSPL